MTYCISDLHGISVERFQALLKQADFSEKDFLFILGDIIDRGEHGIELLEFVMLQPNMELILGNHEALLLASSFAFEEITDRSVEALTAEKLNAFSVWTANGGDVTAKQLGEINRSDPERVQAILEFLQDAPLYETLSVGGREYILCHSGLGNFHPNKKISEYSAHDLLWTRPALEDEYYKGKTVIFGHTPTFFFGEAYRGRALKRDTFIDIDCGAGSGFSPCLFRLEDGKEFYLEGLQ